MTEVHTLNNTLVIIAFKPVCSWVWRLHTPTCNTGLYVENTYVYKYAYIFYTCQHLHIIPLGIYTIQKSYRNISPLIIIKRSMVFEPTFISKTIQSHGHGHHCLHVPIVSMNNLCICH